MIDIIGKNHLVRCGRVLFFLLPWMFWQLEGARQRGHFLFIRIINSHPVQQIRCRHTTMKTSAFSTKQITHVPSLVSIKFWSFIFCSTGTCMVKRNFQLSASSLSQIIALSFYCLWASLRWAFSRYSCLRLSIMALRSGIIFMSSYDFLLAILQARVMSSSLIRFRWFSFRQQMACFLISMDSLFYCMYLPRSSFKFTNYSASFSLALCSSYLRRCFSSMISCALGCNLYFIGGNITRYYNIFKAHHRLHNQLNYTMVDQHRY